jgi:hypothetical protein
MRRLLQLGTLFFVLITLFAPLSECFDRWDPPGISNDTEFAIFAVIFMLCLILLVSKLIATIALMVNLVLLSRFHPSETFAGCFGFETFVPPLNSPPLRI